LASEDGSFYCGATLSPNGGEVMVWSMKSN
jgi:hypothetical protein